MRSIQAKLTTLVVTLLLIACVALAWIATEHERAALEVQVEKRARALASNLAGDSKEPLLAGDDLTLDALIREAGKEAGLVSARLLGRDGDVSASLSPSERGGTRALLTPADATPGHITVIRDGSLLVAVRPIFFSKVRVGEAHVSLDLNVLVEPAVRATRRQLALATIVVVALGVLGGIAFVRFLTRPIENLRSGVEQLTRGDLTVRVVPTSRDEVGELTRSFNAMGEALQEKERIQKAFGRYVSNYVLKELLERPESDSLSGAEREVTILFADVRRFTWLSEGMKARDVVGLLNEVFQLLSDRILARGGTIDKFIGDSVMAYFGAPADQPDHALRAVQSAVDIQRAMIQRDKTLAAATDDFTTKVPVDLGIGIHTGVVIVGNIGSDRRTDYTAVGDAVNVAHRLEKLARPTEILVSEAVQRDIQGAIPLRFEGERQLSGRQEPVHVYSVDLEAEAILSQSAKPDAP